MTGRGIWITVCIAVFSTTALSSPLPGGDAPPSNALEMVPADAAFFYSWSRQREQFDAIRGSQAFSRLMSQPPIAATYGQLFREDASDVPELEELRAWLALPVVQMTMDALSHEIFVYGDVSFTQLVQQFQQMLSNGERIRLDTLAGGETAKQAEQLSDLAALESFAKFQCPTMVIGFRLANPQAALDQLQQLESLVQLSLSDPNIPPLIRNRYSKQTIDGHSYLTMKLDGTLIPAGKINFTEETDPQIAARTRSIIQGLQLTLAVGVRGDYVLVSIGHDTAALSRLESDSVLANHADLERIREQAERQLTSVRYVSSALRSAVQSRDKHAAGIGEYLKQTAGTSEQLTEATRVKLAAAIEAIDNDLRSATATRPAIVGYTVMTDDGFQSKDYDRLTLPENQEGAFHILEHVGTHRLWMWAARGGMTSERYAAWADRGGKAFAQIQQMINTSNGSEQIVFAQIQHYLSQLDNVLRSELVPAIEGGQVGLVLAAVDSARQWHPAMPPADQPLLMPELSLVIETNDYEKLQRAGESLVRLSRELSAMYLAGVEAEAIPPLRPASNETPDGTVHYTPLWPELTGLDAKILAPSAGRTGRWVILSTRPRATERLLNERPVEQELADRVDSVASYSEFQVAGVVDLVQQWLDYAVTQSGELSDDEIAQQEMWRGILDLLACCKSYHRTTYREGDHSVVETQWRFEDR